MSPHKLERIQRFAKMIYHMPDNQEPVAIITVSEDGVGYCPVFSDSELKKDIDSVIMKVAERIALGETPSSQYEVKF